MERKGGNNNSPSPQPVNSPKIFPVTPKGVYIYPLLPTQPTVISHQNKQQTGRTNPQLYSLTPVHPVPNQAGSGIKLVKAIPVKPLSSPVRLVPITKSSFSPSPLPQEKLENNNIHNVNNNNKVIHEEVVTNYGTGQVIFYVNGEKVVIVNPDPRETLDTFLRSKRGLTGTKFTCGEGGCGSCTVLLTYYDSFADKETNIAINSCYRPIVTLDGMSITTTEGVGNSVDGFDPLQVSLAAYNGSQCGFCSPGMIMNMFSLLQNNPTPSSQEIEDHLDGNICRCTGYRPILDAFKTYAATDYDPSKSSCSRSKLSSLDMEDLCKGSCSSPSSPSPCSSSKQSTCKRPNNNNNNNNNNKNKNKINKKSSKEEVKEFLRTYNRERNIKVSDTVATTYQYYHPISLTGLYQLMNNYAGENYKLMVGNTSELVYKTEDPNIFINISDIPDLNAISVSNNILSVGSAVSISKLIDTLNNHSSIDSTLSEMATHFGRIGNLQVRNIASWGGNVALAAIKSTSVSDIAMVFLSKNVTLTIGNSITGSTSTYSISSWISLSSLSNLLILSCQIPLTNNTQPMLTFRTSLRHVNSAPIVNASFLFNISPSTNIISSAAISFGGVEAKPTRAPLTEQQLIGQSITSSSVLSSALSTLSSELPVYSGNNDQGYRESEVTSLFYKYWLYLQPSLPANLQSAAIPYIRPVSSGQLQYQNYPLEYPLTEFIPKLLSPFQCSGEVQYINDLPSGNAYHGVLVLTSQGNATIASIDASTALMMPGVIDFVTEEDIPGVNNCDIHLSLPESLYEPVFTSSKVNYNGQAVGLMVADTLQHARDAAAKVIITYSDILPPILTCNQAIEANSYFPAIPATKVQGPYTSGDVNLGFQQSDQVISGSITAPMQWHFHMELQSVLAVPDEIGKMQIYSSTQWPFSVQRKVADVLDKNLNNITVTTKRCGGGFGGKITRAIPTACAAAVAAHKLNHAVKLILDINTNMQFVGKRHEFLADYKVGFNNDGSILAYQLSMYANSGYNVDLAVDSINEALISSDNTYYFPNFSTSGQIVQTNLPANTSMRAPGCFPAIFFTEYMMEHVSYQLGFDPSQVRVKNFYAKDQTTPFGTPLVDYNMPMVWDQLLLSSDYTNRLADVNTYNENNRWVKKGISIIPVKYGISGANRAFGATMNVLFDGTIQISTNGIEIGQGLDTKITQTTASKLDCPMDIITITPSETQKIPNGAPTGSSVTSGLCSQAVIECCKHINEKLDPLRKEKPNATFRELATLAIVSGISLSTSSWIRGSEPEKGPFNYETYGAAVTEIQLDVLSGDVQILRSDILYDCGKSMNPAIDIGQVEGCFIKGIGYFFTGLFLPSFLLFLLFIIIILTDKINGNNKQIK